MPVNIHLTGCHHSCAQHYIGDIGLIGAKVAVGDDGDTVEGYDIVVGGGFAENARIGRELWKGIRAEDCPPASRRCCGPIWRTAHGPEESFQAFTLRHEIDELRSLACPSKSAEGRPGEGEISASPVRAVAA